MASVKTNIFEKHGQIDEREDDRMDGRAEGQTRGRKEGQLSGRKDARNQSCTYEHRAQPTFNVEFITGGYDQPVTYEYRARPLELN